MPYIDFLTGLHSGTKRDYLARVINDDKAECVQVASRYGREYWDGDRKYGYGGYRYDGRWRPVAEAMVTYYGLKPGHKILDVGCGKGYLLYEFTQVLPGVEIAGIDLSEYAITNAKEEIKPFLRVGNAVSLPYASNTFDLVVSITTLHNLYNFDLYQALEEIGRVGIDRKQYIVVESYRNEREKVNLLHWQLTCRTFHAPKEWEWLYERAGYAGDYSFIFFE